MEHIKHFLSDHPTRVRYGLALLGFVVAILIFGSLADEVHEGDTLRIDNAILTGINQTFATPALTSFFNVATDIGGTIFISIATVIMVAAFVRYRAYSRATMVILSMGGVALATIFLKLIFARQRPDIIERTVSESTFSFPSGHAMGSFALGLTIILLMWSTKWRYAVLAGGVFYILFVGFSRLYLGVHYPTDVLAGWILAAAWVATVFTIFRLNKRFRV